MAQLTQGTLVANLGFSEIAFPAPMFAGDTLYAETECTGKRESKSRPGEGVVELVHVGRNQDGTVVAVPPGPRWCGCGQARTDPCRKEYVQTMPTSGMSDFRWSPPGPAMLFCPADRPERYNKAAERADVGNGPSRTPSRRIVARRAGGPSSPTSSILIARSSGSTRRRPVRARRDLAAIAETTYRVVMVAKAQTADEVARTEMQTIALIETPLGAVNVNEIAAATSSV